MWAGPGARRALAAGDRGNVEIATPPGGYVRLAGDPPGWLHVAPPRAPRGPLTLAVTGLERAPLSPGAAAVVERDANGLGGAVSAAGVAAAGRAAFGGGDAAAGRGAFGGDDAVGADPPRAAAALVIGSLRISLDGLTAVHRTPAPAPPRPGWRGALDAAIAELPPPPEGLAGGLAALRRGAIDDGVALLAGRGSGLTPAGDDVLAGFAAWRHADGVAPQLAARAAARASPIGVAYLRCAERGELPELADRTLCAIRAGDARLAGLRARSLSHWGASSGAAILWGIAAAAAGASS